MRLAIASILLAILGFAHPANATTYHTIPQTIGLQFVADETFVTSTPTRTAFCTWDADGLFLAFQGEQVINPPPLRQMAWYFDTDPRPIPLSGAGTASAVPFGTQNWTLPFFADYAFFAAAAGGAVTQLLRWDGVAWVDASSGPWWVLWVGPFDPYLKAGIPRSMLGSPHSIYTLGFIISSEAGAESTYRTTRWSAAMGTSRPACSRTGGGTRSVRASRRTIRRITAWSCLSSCWGSRSSRTARQGW